MSKVNALTITREERAMDLAKRLCKALDVPFDQLDPDHQVEVCEIMADGLKRLGD